MRLVVVLCRRRVAHSGLGLHCDALAYGWRVPHLSRRGRRRAVRHLLLVALLLLSVRWRLVGSDNFFGVDLQRTCILNWRRLTNSGSRIQSLNSATKIVCQCTLSWDGLIHLSNLGKDSYGQRFFSKIFNHNSSPCIICDPGFMLSIPQSVKCHLFTLKVSTF